MTKKIKNILSGKHAKSKAWNKSKVNRVFQSLWFSFLVQIDPFDEQVIIDPSLTLFRLFGHLSSKLYVCSTCKSKLKIENEITGRETRIQPTDGTYSLLREFIWYLKGVSCDTKIYSMVEIHENCYFLSLSRMIGISNRHLTHHLRAWTWGERMG